MTTRVQSPEIGNALRTALSLDAAGPMGLESSTEIVPVAIVADVREVLTQKYIPVQQAGEQLATAGQYSYSALVWDANVLPRAKRILLDGVTISAPTGGIIALGYKSGGMPGTPYGLARRKVGSLFASNVTARVVNNTSVDAPSVYIDGLSGLFSVLANDPMQLRFAEPVILDAENQAFLVGYSTTNISLRTHWQWREERV